MLPELEICAVQKDAFRELFNDAIDTERRLTANSKVRRNRNTDYSKTEESTNNKNNKTTAFNVALEEKIIWSICKEPGHTTEKCFHSSKAEEAVLDKQQTFYILIKKDTIISIAEELVIIIS